MFKNTNGNTKIDGNILNNQELEAEDSLSNCTMIRVAMGIVVRNMIN